MATLARIPLVAVREALEFRWVACFYGAPGEFNNCAAMSDGLVGLVRTS